MADHQKIHPLTDVETPPTVPLVPRDSSRSEKGNPNDEYYPPFHRTIPVIHSKPPSKKRSCCCKCVCWTLSLLILLLIILGATAGILYAVFKPKLPKYSIDRLRITNFTLDNNSSLFAEFNVRITTTNPNKKIGIYYEDGSHLNVWYENHKLCEGFLPKFYQGHQNITVLDLGLTGQTQDGNSLMTALFEQQQTGSIPLNLHVKVPVRVKLGKLKIMKVKFKVRCKLVVDSLSTDNLIRITSSSCKFKLRI